MKMTMKTIQTLVLSASMLGLAACQKEAQTEVSTEAVKEKSEPVAVVGKPTAPIDIKYMVLGRPEKGKPLQISVSVSPKVAAPRVSVDVKTSDAIQMDKADSHWTEYNQKSGQSDTRVITFTPTSDGRHEIVVQAGIEIDGVMQSRIMLIPIQVGEVQETANAAEVSQDADGTNVVVLPADDQ